MTAMRRYGRWIWLAFGLAFLAGFAFFESAALTSDGLTLSRLIYNANQAWPMVSVITGAIMGGLLVHFFWNWDPRLYDAQERIKALEAEIARLKATR
jgi:hypothetical protein